MGIWWSCSGHKEVLFNSCRKHKCRATLLRIIQQCILPGTIVISDLWKAYDMVSHYAYHHMTVNRKIHFVDPVTHTTTNHIEAL